MKVNAAVSHVKDRDNTVYNILSENQFYIFLDHDNGFVTNLNSLHYSPASRLTSHVSKAMTTKSSKPPNILIYTGTYDTEGRRFIEVKRALSQVINLHSYVIYRIYEQQLTTHPWVENTALLVLGNSDSVSSKVQEVFLKYLKCGGQILSLCSPFTCQVVKKPLDEYQEPFIGSFRTNQEVVSEVKLHFSALCQPYYFEGERF